MRNLSLPLFGGRREKIFVTSFGNWILSFSSLSMAVRARIKCCPFGVDFYFALLWQGADFMSRPSGIEFFRPGLSLARESNNNVASPGWIIFLAFSGRERTSCHVFEIEFFRPSLSLARESSSELPLRVELFSLPYFKGEGRAGFVPCLRDKIILAFRRRSKRNGYYLPECFIDWMSLKRKWRLYWYWKWERLLLETIQCHRWARWEEVSTMMKEIQRSQNRTWDVSRHFRSKLILCPLSTYLHTEYCTVLHE